MPRSRPLSSGVTAVTIAALAVVVAVAVWVGSDLGAPKSLTNESERSTTTSSIPSPSARPDSSMPHSPTPTPTPRTGRLKVVVLDPGHSAGSRAITDPQTGLTDRYYPNYPEVNDVFGVALLVKQRLEAHGGLTVLLTKQTAGQNATYRQRANLANDNHADLGVSIHDQGGLPSEGGLPFPSQNNLVYEQNVGMYAQPRNSSGQDIGQRTTFTDTQVAALSQQYAKIFLAQRRAAEGHPVQLAFGEPEVRDVNDSNIWLVQLFSKVPWIYNEAGGFSPGSTNCGVDGNGRKIPDGACLSTADSHKYATGIANSVIAVLFGTPLPQPASHSVVDGHTVG